MANKFSVDFSETFKYGPLEKSTDGSFFYDAASGRYKISRENGHYDRYCGANGLKIFQNTPCEQIVDASGDRYIHYPEKDQCCFCCDAVHGCGILKPNWQQGAEFLGETEYNGVSAYKWDKGCGILKPNWQQGAEFLGQTEYNGVPAYKWDKKGLQSNFYYETITENPEDRIMLNIDQKPNDNQVYDPATWDLDFDDSELELPSICDRRKSCSW
eukprot:CAMPEP_0197017620 /NCGR_PEP_ID=MMETSP1380-20130617/79645_1 /TAXON_ID=5936 /ORGANISM="Euplotes crassus, Strain CT5" /LENGTH=213 /DNA_ID=CAMNT_0042444747 /DNA_START=73 /DNA_END=713 /DNA_ORIENTATION=+